MTRSSQDIEREVEQTRGDLDRTVEALKEKMSPGQLLDELGTSLSGMGAGDIMAKLGEQVRANPMAVAMVGAGLAWLVAGRAGPSRTELPATTPQPQSMHGSHQSGQDHGSATSGHSGVGEKLASGAAGVTEAASHMKDKAADAAHHSTEAIRNRAKDLADRARTSGAKVQQSFNATLERDPLVLGALGVVVGAALGAALPSTRAEDKAMGALRHRLLEKGRDTTRQGLETAKRVADVAVGEMSAAADREGLMSGPADRTMLDKVEKVAAAGMQAVRQEIDPGRPH